MTHISFKSKIGMTLAILYFFAVFAAIIEVEMDTSPRDAFTAVFVILLTAPWSFWLVETRLVGSIPSAFDFYLRIAASASVNALLLYILGRLLSRLRIVRDIFNAQQD